MATEIIMEKPSLQIAEIVTFNLYRGGEIQAKFWFYVDKIVVHDGLYDIYPRVEVEGHGSTRSDFDYNVNFTEKIKLPPWIRSTTKNIEIPSDGIINYKITAAFEAKTYSDTYSVITASKLFTFNLNPYLVAKFHATQSSSAINDYTAYIYENGSLKKIKEAYITDASGNLKKVV